MNKKKAIIVTALTGFVRAFLLQDIKILQDMGYEVHCAANAIGDDDTIETNKEYFRLRDVTFHHVDFSSNNPFCKQSLRAYIQMQHILESEHFQLISVHTPIPGVLVRLASNRYRKNGTKVVYTTHGFYFHEKGDRKQNILYRSIETFMSLFSDAIVTINKEDFAAAKKMHSKRVFMINGVGVDTGRYSLIDFNKDQFRQQLNLSEDTTVLLSIGEISYRKNYEVVIKALSNIKDKDYVYLICGKGLVGSGIRKELEMLASSLGVNVKFLGYRKDIPEIIGISDIGVIPSRREGLGLAGIEMLAGGIPVVGSSVQGIKDYVVPGVTGFLAEPNDPQGFVDAFNELWNKERRENLRDECMAMASKYDKKVSYEQLTDIYREIDSIRRMEK